jgi:hypothetical protein
MTDVTPRRVAELEESATAFAIARDANAGLSNELARLPLLDEQQVGHLRHIRNLASLPDGDWSFMGIADPGQEANHVLAAVACGPGGRRLRNSP